MTYYNCKVLKPNFPESINFAATKSGEPSFARIYRYPHFETIVASKTFFQADRVDVKWNQKGTAILLTTMTDVDVSGGSYYGKTMLHYLDVKGNISYL